MGKPDPKTDVIEDQTPRQAARAFRELLADRQFPTVFLVWALCALAMFIYLHHYSTPFPWADEWELTSAAAGLVPVDWNWIWCPQGEHRAPLTRLEVLWLGWLSGWDFRLAHYVNLGLLVLGSLVLVLAARAFRGQSALSDAFLAMLVLTPWQYETTLVYAYAYGMTLACLCLAVSMIMAGWHLRSPVHVGLLLLLALVVTLSGGPVGNLWAIGLSGGIVRGWLEKKARTWKTTALVGAVVMFAVSGAMLVLTPHESQHDGLRSDSWLITLKASLKLSVAWLGILLKYVWPWALLVVVLPALYVGGRILQDLWVIRRTREFARARLSQWLDLTLVLLACVSVAVMIGYGRGKISDLWHPRYCTLLLPIGVVLYLLLVRFRSPVFLPSALAFVMAMAIGWNWPEVIVFSDKWTRGKAQLWHDLRYSEQSLSLLATNEAWVVRYECNPDKLLTHWLQLREAGLSAFHKDRQKEPVPGMGLPQVWEAKTGCLSSEFKIVVDPKAASGQTPGFPDAGGRALESASTRAHRAMAIYDIEVPADGCYELCLRVYVPERDHFLTVAIDQGPQQKRLLADWPTYYTYNHEPILLDLNAGKHQLTVTLGKAGMRLDLLELIPRKRGA